MESAGKRRRNSSLRADFLELRNAGVVHTGPKRRRQGGSLPLTPASLEPAVVSAGRRSQAAQLLGAGGSPRTRLRHAAEELIQGAVEAGDLTPAPHTITTLTPSPLPQTQSVRLAGVGVASAPEKTRKNKRALKAVRSLSALTSRGRGAGRVTFGSPVSITDRSPKASATDERGHNQNTPTASEYLGGVALVEEPESSGTTAEETVGGVALEPLGDGEEEEEEEEEGSGSDGAADDESTLQTPPTANQAPSTPDHQELRRQTQGTQEKRGRNKDKLHVPLKKRSKAAAAAPTLPRVLIRNLFGLYCKKRLTREAMDHVMKFVELYLGQASDDLSVYARHAGRRTVAVDDVLLLLKRQRHITHKETFEFLASEHLPLEYVQELLPCTVACKHLVPDM